MNTKLIMQTAWSIAREGALRFGGSAKSYIRSALKAAWEAAKEPSSPIDAIKDHPAVYSASEWVKSNISRVYINLKGFDRSFAGDRNTKLYFDNNSSELVWERGKGTTSRAFQDSLNAITESFAIVRR